MAHPIRIIKQSIKQTNKLSKLLRGDLHRMLIVCDKYREYLVSKSLIPDKNPFTAFFSSSTTVLILVATVENVLFQNEVIEVPAFVKGEAFCCC